MIGSATLEIGSAPSFWAWLRGILPQDKPRQIVHPQSGTRITVEDDGTVVISAAAGMRLEVSEDLWVNARTINLNCDPSHQPNDRRERATGDCGCRRG